MHFQSRWTWTPRDVAECARRVRPLNAAAAAAAALQNKYMYMQFPIAHKLLLSFTAIGNCTAAAMCVRVEMAF